MKITLDQKKATYHFSNKLSKALGLAPKSFVYIAYSKQENAFFIGKHDSLWLGTIECVDVRYDEMKKQKFVVNTMPHPGYIFAVYGVKNQVKSLKVEARKTNEGKVIFKIKHP